MANWLYRGNKLEKPHRLEIWQAGTMLVDLLRPPFAFSDWKPQAPGYKNDGTWTDSPLAPERQIRDKQFTNIIDTFQFTIETNSMDGAIRASQSVRQAMEKASDFWLRTWEDDPVYLLAQNREETNIRYAHIYMGRIAEDTINPFGQSIQQVWNAKRSVWPEMVVAIEHGLWQSTIPETGSSISISGTQLYSDGPFTATRQMQNGNDDAEATPATTSLVLNGATIIAGNDGVNAKSVGFRFRDSLIPKGVTIKSAKITVEAATSQSGTTVNLTIAGEDTGDAALFSSYADFAGRTRTSATVAWSPGSQTAGLTYDTPDLTAIIQEIVNRSDYAYGNALVVFIEDNSSSASAYREWTAYDGTPADSAILEVEYDNRRGQLSTAVNEVYFANKSNEEPIRYIYNYDVTALTYSDNLIDDVTAELYPNPAGNGDQIYFGADNPFCSIVFDLSDAVGATGYTAVWEYWDGAAWSTLTNISDNSDVLQNAGQSVVVWGQEGGTPNWQTTTVNGQSAWWVRLRITALTSMTQNPTQQGRAIHTITWSFFQIPAISAGGDIDGLLEIVLKQWAYTATGNDTVSSIYMGLRSYSRGDDEFRSFINLDSTQNANGVTVTPGASLSVQTDLLAATGQSLRLGAVLASLTRIATINLNAVSGPNYEGLYRLFLRFHVPSGSQDLTLQARLFSRISQSEIEGDVVTFDSVPSGLTFVDLGTWYLPADIIELRLYATSSATTQTYFTDICLLPADEWQARIYNPGEDFGVQSEEGLSPRTYLTTGNITNIKDGTHKLLSLDDDSLILNMLWQQNKRMSAHPDTRQRIYFFLTYDVNGVDPQAHAEFTGSVTCDATDLYLSARGDQ